MILTCPNCSSQFKVNAALIPADGRKVRCASCKHEWVAYSEDRPGELTPAPAAVIADAPMDALEEFNRLIAFPDAPSEWQAQQEAESQAEADEQAQAEPSFDADDAEHQEPLDENELEALDEDTDADADEEEQEQEDDEESQDEPELIAAISPAKDALREEVSFAPISSAPRKAKVLPFALLATVLLAALLVTSFAAFRSSLQPSFAGLYALFGIHPTDGLSLTDVTVRERPSRSMARYIIEGTIINAASEPRHIPVLRIAIIGKDGEVLQTREYHDESHPLLDPNERYAFKASNLEVASKDAVAWFVLDIGNAGDLKLRSPTDDAPKVQLGEPAPAPQTQEPAHE